MSAAQPTPLIVHPSSDLAGRSSLLNAQSSPVVPPVDTEALIRQQAIKVTQAAAKAKAARDELVMQKTKSEGEIAEAQLALTLAELDRDKYLQGEYLVELNERRGAITLAEKELQESKEKVKRYHVFVKKGFGTPEQLRLKEADIARAQYVLDSYKDKLNMLEKFTRKRQETELKAKVDEAKRKLNWCKISGTFAVAKAQSDLVAAERTEWLEKIQLARLTVNRMWSKLCSLAKSPRADRSVTFVPTTISTTASPR